MRSARKSTSTRRRVGTLDALIAEARSASIGVLRLETGVVSHAAFTLYGRAGFQRRESFAHYRPDPLSVFMEKTL